MVESIIQNKKPLKESFKSIKKGGNPKLLPWKEWQDVHDSLKDFFTWTQILEDAKKPTFPLIPLALKYLWRSLEEKKDLFSDLGDLLKKKLKHYLIKRMGFILFHCNDENIIREYYLSTYLDPRFSYSAIQMLFGIDMKLLNRVLIEEMENRLNMKNVPVDFPEKGTDSFAEFFESKKKMNLET